MTMSFPVNATIGELYSPAMMITDQKEADAYFRQLVQHHMDRWGKTKDEAETVVRQNLGYYAGYYSPETMIRVNRLFRTEHPILGADAPTIPAKEAFKAGVKLGVKHAKGKRNEKADD